MTERALPGLVCGALPGDFVWAVLTVLYSVTKKKEKEKEKIGQNEEDKTRKKEKEKKERERENISPRWLSASLY